MMFGILVLMNPPVANFISWVKATKNNDTKDFFSQIFFSLLSLLSMMMNIKLQSIL